MLKEWKTLQAKSVDISQLSEGACEILWDEIHALHMDSTGISWTYSNFVRQPSDSQNVLAVTNVSRFCLVFLFFFYLVISFLSSSLFPCSPLLSDSLTWLPFHCYNGYKLAGKLSAISWHPRFVVISDFSPWRVREYMNTEHNSLSKLYLRMGRQSKGQWKEVKQHKN